MKHHINSALINAVVLFTGLSVTQFASAAALEEIVVTAQKREQSLQDVPLAVTAIDQSAMFERGIRDFEDYLRTVPGVNFGDFGSQANEVKIRGVGLGTQRQSPTTAVYLGEVPVIHTGRGLNSVYNFRLVDMARVEVLRGPQGQLYGSNSLGGAIKNVPNRPNLEKFGFSGQVNGSGMSEGSESYDGYGTINLPISDTFGARLTGYYAEQGGWYDNVYAGSPPLSTFVTVPAFIAIPAMIPGFNGLVAAHPEVGAYAEPSHASEDVNTTEAYGGRLMLTWEVTEDFTADVMLAYQHMERNGTSWARQIPNTPGPIPGTVAGVGSTTPRLYANNAREYEYSDVYDAGNADEMFLANLLLEWDLGFASLTSSTGYWDRTEILDTSIPLDAVVVGVNETFPTIVSRSDNPSSISQEFRLASNDSDNPLSWLAGFWYQKISQDHVTTVTDPSGILRLGFPVYRPAGFLFPGSPEGVLPPTRGPRTPGTPLFDPGQQSGDFEDEQIAIFGEIAYDITPTFNAAFSFRWLDLDQSAFQRNSGFFFETTLNLPERTNSEKRFLPKYTLTWTPTDNQLFYASVSEGFRTGVTNIAIPFGPGTTCPVELTNIGQPNGLEPTESDGLWNYELGTKLTFADGRATFNAAVYRIDWSNQQQQLFLTNFGPPGSQCTFDIVANVGDSITYGAEFELSALLTDVLRLDASLSYINAEHDSNIPQLSIAEGQTMQLTPDIQTFIGLQYDFNLFERGAFVRADWNYIGEMVPRAGDFRAGPPIALGEYHTLNLRGSIDVTENITFDVYVDNVFNEFGVTRAFDLGGGGQGTYHTIRPRVAGASVRWSY